LVVGYTPVRVLNERSTADFATLFYADYYERRCQVYEDDRGALLSDAWYASFSISRHDWEAVGPISGPHFGQRCAATGIAVSFERSLRALWLYERSVDQFVADARSHAQPGMHASVHPALLAAASVALRGVILGSGSAKVWRPQEIATRLLWAVEQRRAPGREASELREDESVALSARSGLNGRRTHEPAAAPRP
jgi:hypothetical protein